MKTLVLSDTHLTPQFEEKKYQILAEVIEEHDQVILNGDFWEGFLYGFDEFVNSKWQSLFPLLRRKNAIYLFGNHDLKKYARTHDLTKFCVAYKDVHEFTDHGTKFRIEHGHRYLYLGDPDPSLTAIFRTITRFWNIIEHLLIHFGGTTYQRYLQHYNDRVKKKYREHHAGDRILICGHTHSQEIDIDQNFANSGVSKFGLVQYITIEKGHMTAHTRRY